jgi:hypothetical protein
LSNSRILLTTKTLSCTQKEKKKNLDFISPKAPLLRQNNIREKKSSSVKLAARGGGAAGGVCIPLSLLSGKSRLFLAPGLFLAQHLLFSRPLLGLASLLSSLALLLAAR